VFIVLQLLRDVRIMKRDVCAEEGGLDVVILATKLSSVGYKVYLRNALGGGAGTDCFHNLRNEFLVVCGEGEEEGNLFIVEGRFREHFAIPHPTERYAGVLASVPTEIASSAPSLTPLVKLLCSEMSMAFEERGLSLPPWRQSKSLLSKWLPTKVRDVGVSSPAASSPGGAGASPESTHMLTLSTASSGIVTPYHGTNLGDDSPRAVLRSAAAALVSHVRSSPATSRGREQADLRQPPLKARSLLSANLAGNGQQSSNTGGTTTPSRGISTLNMTSPAPHKEPIKPSGWVTPPIRRVRMGGLGPM
jgi:uncharacterized protein (TIGR01615 family)